MSERRDAVAGVIDDLCHTLGLSVDEVLCFKIEPRSGDVDVTILDAYRNVKVRKFHYDNGSR